MTANIRTSRRWRMTAAMISALVVLTACGQATQVGTQTANSLEKIKQAKAVDVGFANERPYGYMEGSTLVGEAPAISGYIFEQLGGVEMKPRLFDFGSLIPALNSGRVDAVTAGMFITPERCKQALFGNPEYIAMTALLVKKGNPKGLSDYDSVKKNKSVTLAVMNGAVEADQAKASGVPDGQLQIVADQQSGLDAVTSDRADALALTAPSLRALVKDDPDVEVAQPFAPVVDGKPQAGAGAVVFRKGDEKLRDAYNAKLEKIIESGKWLELVKPYGFTKAEMPDSNATAEQYCNKG